MDNQEDDQRLLSSLGVTTAKPEDIERAVIASVQQKSRGIKEQDAAVQEDEEIKLEAQENGDDWSHHELQLLSRLNALDHEIDAVAAGLDSLQQQESPEASLQDEDNEDSGGKIDTDAHGIESRQLQRALGEERLQSLRKKRKVLAKKLELLNAGQAATPSICNETTEDLKATALPRHNKSADKGPKTVVILDDDEFDAALDATPGFVETERDRLIRTGVVTPFDRLKGFERRVERVPSVDASERQARVSISNVAASMAAIAKSRPTTKLVDPSELPKLAPPTLEYRRIRKIQKPAIHREISEKTSGNQARKVVKRKRPMPEMKWRKRQKSDSDGDVSCHEEELEEVSSGSGDDVEKNNNCLSSKFSGRKQNKEDPELQVLDEEDILLEGGLCIPACMYDNLFDYQKTGVKWLWELHCQRAGGIIADEMGLGKTIQVVAFLAALHHSGLYRPSIVICPVTLLRQWKREVRKWYEYFEVEILHDSAATSRPKRSSRSKAKGAEISDTDDEEIEENESEDVKEALKRTNRWDALIKRLVESKSGILVTTYEQLRILREKLLDVEWGYAVLDEGHRIRNPDAEVTLVCKQLRTVHRIIMTGAPIQNKLTELWSLFDFVFPGKLGVLPIFQAQFALPIAIGGYANATPLQVSTAYKCAVVLRDLIMPYLLRRLKSDVNAQLPKKTEHVLFCSLTDEQRSAYRAFLASSEVEQIFDGSRNSLYGIDILRKICNHPDLLEREHSANHPDYGNPERSGKLRVVAQVLELWKTQGHRVLIFSQTQQMLDILENFIISKEYIYRRMDGSTPIKQRMALIDEFNESSHVFVFILTTRVGGLGTNLIGANKVIIFDPDWNPSTDMQARERAWRIGQKRDVTIYRLITWGTIEEKVYHRQIYKHFLTNKILRDPQQRRIFKARDMRDLFTLNEEKHETKTETSTLFANLGDIELSNQDENTQGSGNSKSGFKHPNEISNHGASLSAIKKEADSGDTNGTHEDESGILKCLFEANGIHSALNHDAIESMNELEKMKMDNESARVAQQAAAAVLQSRMQRSVDNVAVPTWTGRSGTAGAPVGVRRRFGSTTNSHFMSSTSSFNDGSQGPDLLSGGASTSTNVVAGVAGSSVGRALRSTDVLARLKEGRLGLETSNSSFRSNGAVNGQSTGDGRPGFMALNSETLSRELRAFIQQNGGSVSSTVLVEHFKPVVPVDGAPAFRQVLKEIATLKKEGPDARWVLKAEN